MKTPQVSHFFDSSVFHQKLKRKKRARFARMTQSQIWYGKKKPRAAAKRKVKIPTLRLHETGGICFDTRLARNPERKGIAMKKTSHQK